MARIEFDAVAPQFIVADVVGTAEHYRDVLGFEIRGYLMDPPVHAIVRRGPAEIFLAKSVTLQGTPNRYLKSVAFDAYFRVRGLAALHSELKKRGAKILEGPVVRMYDMREVVVEDCNGFVLVFGEDVG